MTADWAEKWIGQAGQRAGVLGQIRHDFSEITEECPRPTETQLLTMKLQSCIRCLRNGLWAFTQQPPEPVEIMSDIREGWSSREVMLPGCILIKSSFVWYPTSKEDKWCLATRYNLRFSYNFWPSDCTWCITIKTMCTSWKLSIFLSNFMQIRATFAELGYDE